MSVWLAALALAAPDTGWEVLQDEQVEVRCQGLDGTSFRCEARAVLAAPPEAVWALVNDPGRFPQVFPSIQSAAPRADGHWDVAVELPWPLPAWPLVVVATVDGPGHTLGMVDVGGGSGVWASAAVHVAPQGEGTLLTWSWSGAPMIGWLHRRVQKTYGHNTIWAVAQALSVVPVAP